MGEISQPIGSDNESEIEFTQEDVIDNIIDHLVGNRDWLQKGFYKQILSETRTRELIERYEAEIDDFKKLKESGNSTMSSQAIMARYRSVMNEMQPLYESDLPSSPQPGK